MSDWKTIYSLTCAQKLTFLTRSVCIYECPRKKANDLLFIRIDIELSYNNNVSLMGIHLYLLQFGPKEKDGKPQNEKPNNYEEGTEELIHL